MTRLQQTLTGLLALQILLAAFVFWPRGADGSTAGPLFPDLTPAMVTRLRIEDDAGQSVALTRRGDGWVLASGGDYPATTDTIDPILEKVAGLQANRLVANSSTSRRQLQVAEDDFLRRVELDLDGGETLVLYVGSSPSARATHVRRADQDAIYLTSDLNVFELNAAATNWVDPVYVGLDRETVTEFSFENANGAMAFVKGADGAWQLADLAEGETFDESAFSLLFNRIISLRLTRPLGTSDDPAYGLDRPQATATVTTSDGTFTLAVGAQDPESGNYAVKWSGADYYVEVAQFAVADLVSNTRESFLVVPTPEPTTPATPAATP